MSRAALAAAPAAVSARPGLGWWALCGALLAVAGGFNLTKTVDHDVAYWLDAAGRLLDGARLYRDLIELNPPVNYLLSLAPVALARGLGLDPIVTFHALVTMLAVACVALAVRIAGLSLREAMPPHWIAPPALFAFLVIPGPDFGQREHLLAMLLLPYLLVAAAGSAATLPAGLRIGIGAMAGLGIAFKPYFLLYLVVAEALAPRPRAPVRAEVVAALAVIAAAAGLTVALFPDYLATIVPLGRATYHGLEAPLPFVLLQPHVVIALCLLAALVMLGRTAEATARRVARALAAAALTALAIYLVQKKGWGYQALPALVFAMTGLGVAAAAALVRIRRAAMTAMTGVGLTIVAAVMTTDFAAEDRRLRAELWPLVELAAREARGAPILVLSSHLPYAFPVVNYSGATWPHRYHHLLPLPGLYRGYDPAASGRPFRAPAAMSAIETEFFATVVEDAVRHAPRLILVDRRPQFSPLTEIGFDFIAYFGQDPRFARLMSEYRPAGRVSRHDVYVRSEQAATDLAGAGRD